MKRLFVFATALLMAFAAKAADLVTIPAGVEPEAYTLAITHAVSQPDGSTADYDKKMTVNVAFDGDDVYIQGLPYYFPQSYVKGKLADGKVTCVSGQFVGEDMYGEEYLMGYTLDGAGNAEVTNFIFDYDAETRTLTSDPDIVIAETSEPVDGQAAIYCFIRKAVLTLGGLPPLVPVEVPEGLQVQSYLLIASQNINEENDEGEFDFVTRPYEIPVNVAFDGDDLYIQGLVENVSYAWAKATKNALGKYVIPAGQYIGTQQLYTQVYDYYLSAIGRTGGLTAITFSYDAATGTISTTQTIAPTASEDQADAYYTLKNVSLKKIEEREATPSAPTLKLHKKPAPYGSAVWYYAEMFLPLTDTEGMPMLADKLSFLFYKDKDGEESPVTFKAKDFYELDEDVTEMPYDYMVMPDFSNHEIYFEKIGETELKSWNRLGLQTIYRGNDIEHRSEITWVDLAPVWFSSGIEEIFNTTSSKTNYYDLHGRRLQAPKKGLNIINGKKVVVR